ncbi:MAG: FG-GAP-like repeat-containing protein [Planctomycetota bacterium]|nr:FG-GAP-like repeat-containing protein [Planctomycetota bacterium]
MKLPWNQSEHHSSVMQILVRTRFYLIPLLLIASGYFGFHYRYLVCAETAQFFQSWPTVHKYANRYLSDHPDSQRGLLLRARSLRNSQSNNPDIAERAYRSVRDLPAEDFIWLSAYYRTRGQSGRLLQRASELLGREPENADARLTMAIIFQERQQNTKALELALQVTKLRPDYVAAWLCLSELYEANVEPLKSVQCLQKVIALKPPRVAEYRKYLARILLISLSQPDQAIKQLLIAYDHQPFDPEIQVLLADCYREQGQPEKAIPHLHKALEMDDQRIDAQLLLAELELYHNQSVESALQVIEQVRKQDPTNIQARNIEAYCRGILNGTGSPQPSYNKNTRAWKPIPVRWQFTEISTAAEVRFHHHSGENKSRRYLPESFGSGVAIFDFDQDTHMDLYFINGRDLAPDEPVSRTEPRNQLFRNLGNGRFVDVTPGSGLDDSGFGHGVAIGDFDNDSYPDVYVTNYGPNRLLRNNGSGQFTDITLSSGTADSGMSTSAAWFDFDEDSDLDLYVCNYSDYDVYNPQKCTHPGIGAIYCGPDILQGQRDTLYRNNGDGSFTDVTQLLGIARDQSTTTLGKGLGVVAADLNQDQHIDLFVANDTSLNFVFFGNGKTLTDGTGISGAAVNDQGATEACMGVDAGDIDGDGDFDLIVTNQWTEKNTLYRNENGNFLDATYAHGLGLITKPAVGWGTALIDLDNDGDLDNFVTNGHFYDWRDEPLRQKPMLFSNSGNGTFQSVLSQAGSYLDNNWIGRGAAFGDIDNDGDIDITINHWGEPCAILRNDTQSAGAWIRVHLIGTASNRDAVGTTLRLRAGTRTFHYQRKGGVSYLSSNDPRLLIGLGAVELVDSLEIQWPSGTVDRFPNIEVGHSYRFIEGSTEKHYLD